MLGPMPHDDEVTAGAAVGHAEPVVEGTLLWAPSAADLEHARITTFLRWLAAERGLSFSGYEELWQWSVDQPGGFWEAVWDFFDVPGNRGDGPALEGGPMPDVRWFAGATVNYARVALRRAESDPDATAVIFRSEAGHRATLTYRELAAEVARVQAGLREIGVTRGDRVTPISRSPACTRATSAASSRYVNVARWPASERKITAVASGSDSALRNATRA